MSFIKNPKNETKLNKPQGSSHGPSSVDGSVPVATTSHRVVSRRGGMYSVDSVRVLQKGRVVSDVGGTVELKRSDIVTKEPWIFGSSSIASLDEPNQQTNALPKTVPAIKAQDEPEEIVDSSMENLSSSEHSALLGLIQLASKDDEDEVQLN